MSCPCSDTKPNWPTRNESPPRVMVQYGLFSDPNSDTRPKWPNNRDDSSPRCIVRPELMAHPNSGSRPTWSIQNDSPPRAMEYYESHLNFNTGPNWPKARYDSPSKSTMHHPMAHPNSYTSKLDWPNKKRPRWQRRT